MCLEYGILSRSWSPLLEINMKHLRHERSNPGLSPLFWLTTLIFRTALIRSLQGFATWPIFAANYSACKSRRATNTVLAWWWGRDGFPMFICHVVDGANWKLKKKHFTFHLKEVEKYMKGRVGGMTNESLGESFPYETRLEIELLVLPFQQIFLKKIKEAKGRTNTKFQIEESKMSTTSSLDSVSVILDSNINVLTDSSLPVNWTCLDSKQKKIVWMDLW